MGSPLMCSSPSASGSPCPTSILSEPDDDELPSLLKELEDTPSTPPVSPQIPSGHLEVRIYYGTILARTDYVDCSKGACRILSNSAYTTHDKKACHLSDHTIELPDNHPQLVSKNIFGAMGNGIVLEVIEGRVYVTPLCRTIVYCSNMSSPGQDAMQINKDQPTKVFDYNNHFRPTLEHYAILQGQSPSPSFFLGLGQTWGPGRNVTQNLISVMVTHCKAKQDIDAIMLPPEILGGMNDINIDQPTVTDLEAEAFLKNLQEISN